MNRNRDIKYNPSITPIDLSTYSPLGKGLFRTIEKDMLKEKDIITILKEHPLLSEIDWSGNNLVLAGGYLSRLLCGDSLENADIDLFLYGIYSRADLRLIANTINQVYKSVKWYRTGCVLIADCEYDTHRNIQVQIMCTNHKTRADVIDVFDATYVQCGWDGESIFVLPDFNKYTPFAIAKITRPTCSVWRKGKAKRRGFNLVLRENQHVMWVVKNPMNIYNMDYLPLDRALTEVNIHGDFNPYIETSYYDLKDAVYERCHISVELTKSNGYNNIIIKEDDQVLLEYILYPLDLNTYPAVAIKDDSLIDVSTLVGKGLYPAYKLVDKTDGSVSHVRIVADEHFEHIAKNIPILKVTVSIGDDQYEIPIDKLAQFKL